MAKIERIKLLPEVTEPRFRGFLDIVPAVRRMNAAADGEYPVLGEEIILPLEGRELKVYLHRAATKNRPVIFEFHGGGFVFGSAVADGPLCETICKDGDLNVVGVDYRLAPENMYPKPLDDAYDTVKYFFDNAKDYDIDASKIGVIGCSAGATLATVTAIRAGLRGEVKVSAQVLNYPYLDARTALEPREDLEHYDVDLDSDMSYGFTKSYSTDEECYTWEVSPILASKEQLRGTADAYILTAGCDMLKFSGKEYAEKLKEAGVNVRFEEVAGVHHCYIEDAQNMDRYNKYSDPVARKKHNPEFAKIAAESLKKSIEFFNDTL